MARPKPTTDRKKLNLSFVEPAIVNDRIQVSITPEILLAGTKNWSSTLVGYFVGSFLPFSAVNTLARRLWSKNGLEEVLSFDKGYYFFKFSSEEDLSDVLEQGPWLLSVRPLVLKKWSRGLKLTKDSLDRIPIWAHFHNIPLEFWSEEGLSRIASAVGRTLYGDAATESCSRINFAKICVEVQADQTLIDSFDVLFPDEQGISSSCSIKVSYPWKPPSCSF